MGTGGGGDPFRRLAELEMRQGNYLRAREVLVRAASRAATTGTAAATSASSSSSFASATNAELLYTWAICEWHLEEPDRALVLLEHALRKTSSSSYDGSLSNSNRVLRALILYSMARLHYER